ncbi:MAG: RidA family protein [Pseudomonadota bacterium]
MSNDVNARLKELDIALPDAPAPAANYVPAVRSGNLLFVSGQVAMDANGLVRGKLGENMSVEEGQKAARLCALNIIAQVQTACGDLNRVARLVKVTGFVNSTGDFTQHPQVINGASDLFAEVFGEAGKHARAAVGSSSLPLGVAVEVEAIVELQED